jgi:hypothetical protein
MPASLRTSLTHGEQSWEENTVLPKNNPLRFGRVKCIGEKRMPVRIVHENHEHTPALELGLLVLVQEYKGSASKWNHHRGIWKPLSMHKLIRGCPHSWFSIKGRGYVADESSSFDCVHPHKKGST